MTQALLQALPVFVPTFGRALLVNLEIAAHALAIGLPAGLALGWLCCPPAAPAAWPGWRRLNGRVAAGVVALLRAAPAFVVMYVLLHALSARWAVSAQAAVALALAAYCAAFLADHLLATLVDHRAGARGGVLLFALGVVRVYFVMVLSSGFGAAIGVTEATAVTLRALERLPTFGDRLWLLAGVVLVFIALRQAVQAAIHAVRWLVERRAGWLANP
ncbi:hypothetical protein [Pseudorhodoferax soli]|uniref:Uncharacterized protein n=1 Tax=Pseudorhodoferax soli TaxID=545864 RepID=A0A368Y839_9BURK|nr:hypothetical protein [Pseudorhodoferax soli]RCW76441.1 hypothetical protein DES41_1011047 [Pseudorhodoferax soli]